MALAFGFLGLGIMGGAMASLLLKQNVEVWCGTARAGQVRAPVASSTSMAPSTPLGEPVARGASVHARAMLA